MSIGRLKVKIYNGNVGMPSTNTSFIIRNNTNTEIVAEGITDISGQSDIMELEAPDVEYSLEPTETKPYSEYDVIVQKEGYDQININGVQVFANATADQNVFLSTSKNMQDPNVTYNIPEHTLYGTYPAKIPEDEVKPLPNPTGFVVLDSPVVPEFIIVHDGSPDNTSANNYWIPYKEYIKNVCSSEIYPTWPYECIKANALSIISFTLNRVYTEWYRSRGYGFTITSSTAYDQKFIYERNIFDEISEVIDEIFSTFITKPNIEQPLFTQYCDGERVTCPNWLSQWGSKYMADNGADYMNILKNYYGYDIYLETAKEVAGVPSSYPGEILQVGSTGNNVKTIQQQLNSISNNYPAIPKISADGIYGAQTAQAVEVFQKIFSLPQNGIVDYGTWYQISKIYVAVEKLS